VSKPTAGHADNEDIELKYVRMWVCCRVRTKFQEPAKHAAELLSTLTYRQQYVRVATVIGCPWELVAVLDFLEAGGRCCTHLHNGDNLDRKTTHAPKNRPPAGWFKTMSPDMLDRFIKIFGRAPSDKSPYAWQDSAVDALMYDGAHKVGRWTIAGMLGFLEKYNGMGYRSKAVQEKSPGIQTPYLWSGTYFYGKPEAPTGKYVADGKFDPGTTSAQIGCVPILKALGWTPQP
jgi:lysozyme family protein